VIAIYCDGLCDPNPDGVMCWAWEAHDAHGDLIAGDQGCLPRRDGATNNVAEAGAILQALRWAVAAGQTSLTVYSDSRVVLGQIVSGRAGTEALETLRAKIAALAVGCSIMWHWIPREQNAAADARTKAAFTHATGRTAREYPRRTATPQEARR
jgi:ribonuclease HI